MTIFSKNITLKNIIMIIGKNSWKLGFGWYGRTVLKLMGAVCAMAYGGGFAVAVGILLILVTAYEALVEFKKLSE